MRRSDDPPEPLRRQLLFWVRRQREIRKIQHNSANYSRDLIRLVTSCLRYDRKQRPDATKLLRRVRRRMRNHLDGFDTYGLNSRIPWNKRERLRTEQRDIWAAGIGTDIRMRV